MAQNDDIYQYFRCIGARFGQEFKATWDNRNKESCKNLDKDGRCTNEARPSKVTCERCHAYYS